MSKAAADKRTSIASAPQPPDFTHTEAAALYRPFSFQQLQRFNDQIERHFESDRPQPPLLNPLGRIRTARTRRQMASDRISHDTYGMTSHSPAPPGGWHHSPESCSCPATEASRYLLTSLLNALRSCPAIRAACVILPRARAIADAT